MKLRLLEQSLKPETHIYIYTLCQLLAIQFETIHITSRVVNYNKLATSSMNGQLDDTSIIAGGKNNTSSQVTFLRTLISVILPQRIIDFIYFTAAKMDHCVTRLLLFVVVCCCC